MANGDFSVFQFQIEYPPLNLKAQTEDTRKFDYGMIYCYSKECENGFKVKKVGKTTKKGTKFTYEKIKDKVDFEQYKVLLNKMIEDFNTKYGESLKAVSE